MASLPPCVPYDYSFPKPMHKKKTTFPLKIILSPEFTHPIYLTFLTYLLPPASAIPPQSPIQRAFPPLLPLCYLTSVRPTLHSQLPHPQPPMPPFPPFSLYISFGKRCANKDSQPHPCTKESARSAQEMRCKCRAVLTKRFQSPIPLRCGIFAEKMLDFP